MSVRRNCAGWALSFAALFLLASVASTVCASQKRRSARRNEERPSPGERPAPAPAAASWAYRDAETLVARQMKWRPIGPAIMGGRISSIAVDPKRSSTVYVGTATGGLFKTTNNGTTWSAVFEHERVASVGAVAVAPDGKTVWLGTGEPNGRNSSSWGDGIYKSVDAGATWTNVGLTDSQDISRIAIDPANPDTVYVAALGHLWGANKERGIFKTTDGGKRWEPCLQIDADTGAIDLAMDPTDHEILYAAMYYRRRTPYSFASGGKQGGIYKTIDGGRTWKKLSDGLPLSTGRIGLDIYHKNPSIIYAVVESDAGGQSSIFDIKSKAGGVFRSEDKGETWKRTNGLAPRGFYFSQIRVDPNDEKRVYVLGFGLSISDDAGKTFRDDGAKAVHPDLHDLWIDPGDSDRLLLGTDGGAYSSYDRAENWTHVSNAALGEFYRLAVDMEAPYHIAGGLQDNFNWIGASATMRQDGITNRDWQSLGGGDGMYCAIDPQDPDVIYSESQNGTMSRLDLKTGQRKSIQPSAKEGQPVFRFNWTAPFLISNFDHTTLYLGGNRLFKLTDRGNKWEAISPDLSTQDINKVMAAGSGAEMYGTIFSLAESPFKQGVIWAGTDDGKLWLTRDDGKNWSDLTANLPAQVKGFWINRIEASHFDEGTAYCAIDGHRNDVYTPFLLKTIDFGQTWESIAADLPEGGPVKVVREDVKNKVLLFAGTEFGIFASIEGGQHWVKLEGGMPTVAVDDILIHPRDLDLIAGTHGRSIYVIDDIRPLEEISGQVLSEDLHLFSIRAAREFYYLPSGEMTGAGSFKALNPPFGAYIDFYVKEYTGDSYSIAISDGSGQTIKKLSGPALPGINRVIWNLQPETQGEQANPEERGQPPLVRPGEYSITLTVGKFKAGGKVTVEAVPGFKVD